MAWREIRSTLLEAARNWSKHNIARHSAALSFYAMLALAPILILSVAISALFLDANLIVESIQSEVSTSLGKGAGDFLVGMIERSAQPSASVPAAIIAFLFALYAGSSLFTQLIDSVEDIWEISSQSHPVIAFLKTRLVSVVSLVIFLMIGSIWLALDSILGWIGRTSGNFAAWPAVSLLASGIVATLLFAVSFRAIPRGRVQWRDVWLGAGIAGFGFSAAKLLLSLYFSYSGVAAAYGPAGALLVILLWIYYSAHIYFYGAEITRVATLRRQPKKSRLHLPI